VAPAPHWLSPAGKTKTPNVVVTFDTETVETDAGDHSVQVLRCWDAVVRVRRHAHGRSVPTTFHQGERGAALADVIEEAAQLDTEAWVVAHNVGFDLAVTSLPFVLCARGWEIDGLHLGDESSWWVLVKDRHKVIITDSWSWLRSSLADAAKDINRRKLRLPDDGDDLATWHRRCRHDVLILDELLVTLMDWWDSQDLGAFGITGPACGWRTLRKLATPRRILVGPDGERTAFERRAVFGGKKAVYGVGDFTDVWIADYDFVAAYPTAAAAFPLPQVPIKKWVTSEHLGDHDPPPGRDYIAEVEITTRVPCAPCRIDDEIFEPVGTFRTTLAGPEVRYAATLAESVTVLDHQAYKTGFALAPWAAWILTLQSAPPHEVPPVVARVAKNWGRLAIGRFASRTSRVIATRPSTHPGWHLETGHDLDTGASLEWLSMNGVERTIAKDLDGNDVFPAVLAFIEAHVRVGLARMMATRPSANLLQCNTDGWWELRASRLFDDVPTGAPWPFRVTRKALERRLTVKGPNHVLTAHERRYAGVPDDAATDVEGVMHWRDWPSLRWQLEHGATGEYRRPDREAILSDHFVRRWVLTTGETIPATTRVNPDGSTTLEPWSVTWGRRAADELAPYQVPSLAALLVGDHELRVRPNVPLPDQPGRGFVAGPQPLGPRKPRPRRPVRIEPAPANEPLYHLADS